MLSATVTATTGTEYELHLDRADGGFQLAILRDTAQDGGFVMDTLLPQLAAADVRDVWRGVNALARAGAWDKSWGWGSDGRKVAPVGYEPTFEDYHGYPEDEGWPFDEDAALDAELERRAELVAASWQEPGEYE